MKQLLAIPAVNGAEENGRLIKEYGVGFEYNDFFIPSLLDSEEKYKETVFAYKKYRKRFNTLHGAFFDVVIHSCDRRIAEVSKLRVIQSVDAACDVGARKVIFHTNTTPDLGSDSYAENWIDTNTAFFSELADMYPDMIICIENMFDRSPDLLRELMKRTERKNLRVCLDIAHAFVFGGDPFIWIDELKPYISHIHINDNDGKSDLHLPIGQGIMPYEKIIPFLNETDASVLIEVNGAEAFEKSFGYLDERGLKIER